MRKDQDKREIVVKPFRFRKTSSEKQQDFKERLDKKIAEPLIKFSLVNQNYEMLKKVKELQSRRRFLTLRAFLKNKLAVFSLAMLILTILAGIIIPFTTVSPTYFYNEKHLPALSGEHILGTDLAGRDLWARMWHGLRFSIGLAAVATVLDVFLGVIIGILMGYFAWFDKIMQFLIKVIQNVPSIFILTLFVLFLNPSFWVLALSMVVSGWIPMSQIIRGEVLQLKLREFTLAEKSLGSSSFSIILSYLPSLIPMIITQVVLTIPVAFYYDVSLALIGLAAPNVASIGSAIGDAQAAATIYPLEIVFPILVMTSIIIYVQFIGNAIEDVLSGVSRG